MQNVPDVAKWAVNELLVKWQSSYHNTYKDLMPLAVVGVDEKEWRAICPSESSTRIGAHVLGRSESFNSRSAFLEAFNSARSDASGSPYSIAIIDTRCGDPAQIVRQQLEYVSRSPGYINAAFIIGDAFGRHPGCLEAIKSCVINPRVLGRLYDSQGGSVYIMNYSSGLNRNNKPIHPRQFVDLFRATSFHSSDQTRLDRVIDSIAWGRRNSSTSHDEWSACPGDEIDHVQTIDDLFEVSTEESGCLKAEISRLAYPYCQLSDLAEVEVLTNDLMYDKDDSYAMIHGIYFERRLLSLNWNFAAVLQSFDHIMSLCDDEWPEAELIEPDEDEAVEYISRALCHDDLAQGKTMKRALGLIGWRADNAFHLGASGLALRVKPTHNPLLLCSALRSLACLYQIESIANANTRDQLDSGSIDMRVPPARLNNVIVPMPTDEQLTNNIAQLRESNAFARLGPRPSRSDYFDIIYDPSEIDLVIDEQQLRSRSTAPPCNNRREENKAIDAIESPLPADAAMGAGSNRGGSDRTAELLDGHGFLCALYRDVVGEIDAQKQTQLRVELIEWIIRYVASVLIVHGLSAGDNKESINARLVFKGFFSGYRSADKAMLALGVWQECLQAALKLFAISVEKANEINASAAAAVELRNEKGHLRTSLRDAGFSKEIEVRFGELLAFFHDDFNPCLSDFEIRVPIRQQRTRLSNACRFVRVVGYSREFRELSPDEPLPKDDVINENEPYLFHKERGLVDSLWPLMAWFDEDGQYPATIGMLDGWGKEKVKYILALRHEQRSKEVPRRIEFDEWLGQIHY